MRALIDSIVLAESGWKLAMKYAYRSWYHPETREWIKVDHFATHAREVEREPERFGIEQGELAKTLSLGTEEERILELAFERGWVRVAAANRNAPEDFMIVQGADLKTCIRVAKMFFSDMGGAIKTLGIRVGDHEFIMPKPEAVKAGLMRGELPAPSSVRRSETAQTV